MKISDFNSKFRSDLNKLYTVEEVSSLFRIVLEELLFFDITKFYLKPDYILNNTELDIESVQEKYENCNSCNFCNLCTFCNFSRINDQENNLEEDDDLIVHKRYFTCCICNIKNIVYPENYNSLRESYLFNRLLDYTKQLGTLLGIILVPIFLTCIVLLIQTKGTIVNEQIPNSLNDIVLLLGIFWCMGMLIILLTCFVINCITCKLRCN